MIAGEQYGLLTVVGPAEPHRKPSGGLVQRVTVACACGSPDRVVRTENLTSGNSRSCGCRRGQARPARRAEFVTYTGMHSRLARQRSKASAHTCVDCEQPAREWSYNHDDPDEIVGEHRGSRVVYSLDVEHYNPRCSRCHNALDRRPRATCKRGHPIDDAYRTAEGKRAACRACKAEAYAETATCKRGHRLAVTGIYDTDTARRLRCWVCTVLDTPPT